MMTMRLAGLAERAAHAIERQDRLGPVEDRVQHAVTAAFSAGGRRLRNFLHGTWLGHPLHPVLTDIPVGAWTVALALDVADAAAVHRGWDGHRGRDGLRRGADRAVALGIAGAVGAALAGLADWQHTDGAARRTGLAHATLNSAALGLYSVSLLARRRGSRRPGRLLAGAGFAVVLASAYLGGRLVFRHRMGVDHADRRQPDGFVRAVRADELIEGRPRRAEVHGVAVVLVRRGDRIHALGERCSHLGGPLAEGELTDDSLTCPWHGSRFALTDGRVLDGPATMPQPCFDTRVRDGYVEIRRSTVPELAAA
jgi:nitrite reductase/ring-hydroxylating ferredoxin subunit/uncharacterized membrane protein